MSLDDSVDADYPPDLDNEDPATTSGASMDDTNDTDFVPDSLAAFLADAESQLEAALAIEDVSPVKSLQPSASLEDVGEEDLKPALDGIAPNLSDPVKQQQKPLGSTKSPVESTHKAKTKTVEIKSDKKLKPTTATSTKKKTITKSSKKRKQRAPTAAADLFSPCSDVAGPYDTDMGSACRPNPASQFMTHAAAQYEALGHEEPSPDVEGIGGVRFAVSKVEVGGSEALSDLKEEPAVIEKVVAQEPAVSRRLDFEVAGAGDVSTFAERAEPQSVELSEEQNQPETEQRAAASEDLNESQFMPNVSFAPNEEHVPDNTMISPSAPLMGPSTPDPKPLSPPAINLSHMSVDDEQFFPNWESAYSSTRTQSTSSNSRKSTGSVVTKKKVGGSTGRKSAGVGVTSTKQRVSKVGTSKNSREAASVAFNRLTQRKSSSSVSGTSYRNTVGATKVSSKARLTSAGKPTASSSRVSPASPRLASKTTSITRTKAISNEIKKSQRIAGSTTRVGGTTSLVGATRKTRPTAGKENNKAGSPPPKLDAKALSKSRLSSQGLESGPKPKESGITQRRITTTKSSQNSNLAKPHEKNLADRDSTHVKPFGGGKSKTTRMSAENGRALSQNPEEDPLVTGDVPGPVQDGTAAKSAPKPTLKKAMKSIDKHKQRMRRSIGTSRVAPLGSTATKSATIKKGRTSLPAQTATKLTSTAESHGESVGLKPPRTTAAGKPPRLSTLERLGEKPCPTTRSNPNSPNRSFPDLCSRGGADDSMQSCQDSLSSKQKRPRVTKPIPFNLSQPRSASSTPVKSTTMAEGFDDFMKKSLCKYSPIAKEKAQPKLTRPVSPNLSRNSTPKRPAAKSTQQMEEEMMEHFKAHPFKAMPIGRGVMSPYGGGGEHGVPRIQKKSLTTPSPFRLHTEERHATPGDTSMTTEEIKAKECEKQFHARPMPDLSYRPPKAKTATPRQLTAPAPFRLNSEKRTSTPGEKPMTTEEIQAKECEKQFHARPMPDLSYRPPSTPKNTTPRQLTTPSPFRLHTDSRNSTPGEKPMTTEEMRAKECEKQFHARPMPDLSYRPPSAPRDAAPRQTTTPVTLKILERLANKPPPPPPSPKETDDPKMSHFHARPLPKSTYRGPSSSPSCASGAPSTPLTVPRPPRLSTGKRTEKRQAAAEASRLSANTKLLEKQKATERRQRKKHREMMAQSNSNTPAQRELTTPEPFHLECDVRHETYQKELEERIHKEEEEARRLSFFKAKPINDGVEESPTTTRVSPRKLTEPKPFNLHGVRMFEDAQRNPPVQSDENGEGSLFKARPLPRSTFEAPVISPSKSEYKLVEPQAPKFRSDERARTRSQYDSAAQKRREEDIAAKMKMIEQREKEIEEEIKKLRRMKSSEGGLVYEAHSINEKLKRRSHETPKQDVSEVLEKEERELKRLSSFKARRFSGSAKRDMLVPQMKSEREVDPKAAGRSRVQQSSTTSIRRRRNGRSSRADRRDQSLAVSANLENLESSLEAVKI